MTTNYYDFLSNENINWETFMKHIFLSFIIMASFAASKQEYFQQEVAYSIDVTLNDSLHTLSAFESIIYKNNSPDTLSFLWFHIWPNAYKDDSTAFGKQSIKNGSPSRFINSKEKDRGFIDSLNFTVDGLPIEWNYHPKWIDVVKLDLEQPLFPGQSITIDTPFFVKLPIVFSRLGHTGKHYEITQWYPKPAVYDHKGWHPMPYLNQGEFYSEFGTFDVKITLPKQYRIMATGDLVNGDKEYAWLDSLASEGDSLYLLPKKDFKKKIKAMKKKGKKKTGSKTLKTETKTLHFHQENVHDFAWFADKKWIVRKGKLFLADSTKEITLWSFYLPKNAELWEDGIEYLHDSGYWYSKFYGDYPYNHITAVDGDLSAGGGMEYPNITVIAKMPSKDMLEMVIMHEVGHNWFYGILGSNERDHTWMDEGLNEYTNIRYWQKKYVDRNEQFVIQDFIQNKMGVGKSLSFSWFNYMQYAGNAKSRDAQPLNLTANEYTRGNYGQHYAKTAVFMRFLQHYLGEEKMDEIMKDYYETWKFRHPYPEDLEDIFTKHTDRDLKWFFNGVFNQTTFVDYGIAQENEKFILTNVGTFKCPVEVGYFKRDGKLLQREWVEGFQWQKLLHHPVGTHFVTIDPDQHMPDTDRTNNTTRKKLKFHFVWDKPTYYSRDINIVPWLFSYNYYNGFTPGIVAFSGFLPGYGNISNSLSILYDFKNNTPVGGVSFLKGLGSSGIFHKSSGGLKIERFAGRQGANLGFTGTIKKRLSRSPITKINSVIYYHNLDSSALDPNLYSGGTYVVGSIKVSSNWTIGISKRFGVETEIKVGNGFGKTILSGYYSYRFNKKLKSKIRIFGETFISDKKVPLQYRTYLSGGVNPDFNESVLDRTGKSKNLRVLNNMIHKGGPELRGLVLDSQGLPLATTKYAYSVKIDQTIPYMPGTVFLDYGGGDFETPYVTAGFEIGGLIIPLYQSWETDNKTPNNLMWIFNRIRFQFKLDGLIKFSQ